MSPPKPVPKGLARVYESFGHHLVILMLVACADDEVAAVERDVILRYCQDRVRQSGSEFTPGEMSTLEEFLRDYHPSLAQIIAAIHQLKFEAKSDIAELIAGAHAVVEADGVVRAQEALYLGSLRRDLLALT